MYAYTLKNLANKKSMKEVDAIKDNHLGDEHIDISREVPGSPLQKIIKKMKFFKERI